MGERLLYSQISPGGKATYIASFPGGGEGYYGGKATIYNTVTLCCGIAIFHVFAI